jgi:formylmethanofuran dehydrogenase subunit B
VEDRVTQRARTVEAVTCLGCGCLCDDLTVLVRGDRIVEVRKACPLGAAWFGDGRVPTAVLVEGRPATLEAALDHAAALLSDAHRALVYLSTDISCEAQRVAVAIADRLRGVADGVSSSTVAAGILAAQRRGRAAATLGEIRNRADLVVFWGVDPAERYPRFCARYAPDPEGLFIPGGRSSRTVVAVDIDEERGPADADLRVSIAPRDELDAVAALRATIAGRPLGKLEGTLSERLEPLARRLTAARYAAIVYDAEPAGAYRPYRAEAVIALAQQLNDVTRCALSPLRAGGNRTGAEAVLTWQTGYPMAIDFSRGHPRYRPDADATAITRAGEVDAVLVVGDPRGVHPPELARLLRVVIGPRASELAPLPQVAIDTGVAGIHEGGMAFRMDEIPLPLRPVLPGPLEVPSTLRALLERLAPPSQRSAGEANRRPARSHPSPPSPATEGDR